MFNFDDFVNRPAMEIFGRPVMYRPKNTAHEPFAITGDFHESFMEINLKNAGADISSAKIVLFVRLIDFPTYYPEPKEGFEECPVNAGSARTRWVIDTNIPMFKGEDRDYIDKLIYVGE